METLYAFTVGRTLVGIDDGDFSTLVANGAGDLLSLSSGVLPSEIVSMAMLSASPVAARIFSTTPSSR